MTALFATGVHAETLRDPTRPLNFSASAESRPTLVLQAIYYGNGRKEAIVNGELVRAGSRVAGAEIIQVASHKVIYKRGADTGTLVIRPKVSRATQ